MVFSPFLKKNSKVKDDDFPAFDSSKKIITGCLKHVLSVFLQALMPYRPCAVLHIRKTMHRAQSKSISDEDQNLSEQRIKDRFCGDYG